MMHITGDFTGWSVFGGIVLLLLILDLGILHRRERVIQVREAVLISLGYCAVAMAFGGWLYYAYGSKAGYEFFTGYLIEQSLSMDNLFVFVLIFTHLGVPAKLQHRVLFWGIVSAMAMRGTLIVGGSALVHAFEWVLYLFGAFLLFTGFKMLTAAGAEPDMENNKVIRFLRRRFRITGDFHGRRFFIRQDGLLYATPLFVALALIEITDLVFALDSIPAIFAVTRDPFIIYTSNIFAILGLRALYFALAGALHRFEYLKYGLSLILMLIGGKMLVNTYFGEKIISTETALVLTAVLLAGSALLSLAVTSGIRGAEKRRLRLFPKGWVPGSGEKTKKP